jgi:cold shock CspA family protein
LPSALNSLNISGLTRALTVLVEGARISYELVAGRNGKKSAENLRI